MGIKRGISIEEKDESLSPQFWESFNDHLTRKFSWNLFSEMSSEFPVNNQAPVQATNFSEEPIEEMVSLDANQQEISTQHEPAHDHTQSESEEYAPGNRKNICGYVLKSVVQEFYRAGTRRFLEKQCRKQGTTYSQVISHFKEILPKVLGISALTSALTPRTDSQLPAKEVFRKFMRWYLRKRYMIALLKSGKMTDKLSYIDVKNKKMLYFQYELAKTLLSMNSINN